MQAGVSSTLLCRLAIALLAVMGFVAPLAQPEADGVVQTAAGRPVAVVSPRAVSSEVEAEPAAYVQRASLQAPVVRPAGRRWLLHRALLL